MDSQTTRSFGPSRRERHRVRGDDFAPYQRPSQSFEGEPPKSPGSDAMPRKEEVAPFRFSVSATSFGTSELAVPKRKEEFAQNPTTPNFGPLASPSVVLSRESSPSNKKQPPSIHNFPAQSNTFSSTPDFHYSAASPMEAYKSPRAFGEGMEQPLTPTANFQVAVDYEEKVPSGSYGSGSSPFFQPLYPTLSKKGAEDSDSMEEDASASDSKSQGSSSPFGEYQFGAVGGAKDSTSWNISTTFTPGVSFGATSTSDNSASSDAQEESENASSPAASVQFGSSDSTVQPSQTVPSTFSSEMTFGTQPTEEDTTSSSTDSAEPSTGITFGSSASGISFNIPTSFSSVQFGTSSKDESQADDSEESKASETPNEAATPPPPPFDDDDEEEMQDDEQEKQEESTVQFGAPSSQPVSFSISTSFGSNTTFGSSSSKESEEKSTSPDTTVQDKPASPSSEDTNKQSGGFSFVTSNSGSSPFNTGFSFTSSSNTQSSGGFSFPSLSDTSVNPFAECGKSTNPFATTSSVSDKSEDTKQEKEDDKPEEKNDSSIQFGAPSNQSVSFSVPSMFDSNVTFGSSASEEKEKEEDKEEEKEEAKEEEKQETDSGSAIQFGAPSNQTVSFSVPTVFDSNISFGSSSVSEEKDKEEKKFFEMGA